MPDAKGRTPGAPKATLRRVLLLLGAVVPAGLTGCAARQGPTAVSSDQWLAGKGFAARGDWASTALHLRGSQLQSTLHLSTLLRRVPDVRLRPTRSNPLGLTRLLDDGASCAVAVYLNGVAMVPGDADAQVDLDARVGVPELDALELHLGTEGPVRDPEGCGSLLLWDRSMRHVEDPAFVGSIRGRVVGGTSDVLAGIRIAPDGPLQQPDAEGFFRFDGLLPGEYRVEVVDSGGGALEHTTRVYAFIESTLEVNVRARR